MKPSHFITLAVLCAGFAAWSSAVLLSGAGYSLGGRSWNFGTTAAFGDSFGALSALLAGAAAVFTYWTLLDTRAENKRLLDRDSDRSVVDNIRDSERTFFHLLELRLYILRDIRVHVEEKYYVGTDAIHQIAEDILNEIRYRDQESLQESFQRISEKYKNDIGHYLGFTYRIIKFASEKFPSIEASYEYIRFLRSQLSSSEQRLIALSCAYGTEFSQLKEMVERYAILHNISSLDRSHLQLDKCFTTSAFDFMRNSGG